MKTTLAALAILTMSGPANPQPSRRAPIQDALRAPSPGAVRFRGGFLGERYSANEQSRLARVDENDLLDAFERRDVPHHAWQGEHAGKFLHAATLTWATTGNNRLRSKTARVVQRLVATQEADGYLGTYPARERWTGWDVWSHKYNLIGLLTYHQHTGSPAALAACRRMGDLLIRTFGPGQRDINRAGEHVGMAATSVLEPMVLLYRATGDRRYLAFAEHIVRNYDAPGGPAILAAMEQHGSVARTANGKAYEMLSNLNGVLELYRETGQPRYLAAVETAWKDIVAHRLYVTGSMSAGEHFHDTDVLPNNESANLCETCVTVTWEQMNLHLLRLTGDARYADQLERTVCNHLTAAQKPTGDQWCYYTALEGHKPYGAQTNCCLSSGPRGVALLPGMAVMTRAGGGVVVNLYNALDATVALPNGRVTVSVKTGHPWDGDVRVSVRPASGPVAFPLLLRIPAWAEGARLTVNGTERPCALGSYAEVARTWTAGDEVRLRLPMEPRVVRGIHGNAGKAAVMVGPIVLAADTALSPGIPVLRQAALAEDGDAVRLERGKTAAGRRVFHAPGEVGTARRPATLGLTPFAMAGADGHSRYAVWLALPGHVEAGSGSLLLGGTPDISRSGNVDGDVLDDDFTTFRVTWNARWQDQDWFGVALPQPARIGRVVFAHGRVFHDGGWFDASAGKPVVQVRERPGGPWVTVATLAAYPDTTATNPAGLKDGQPFTVAFAPVAAIAVRVLGRPASGDQPGQGFTSCAELQAFRS